MTLSEKLDWLYLHAQDKQNKEDPIMLFHSDEEKLLAALILNGNHSLANVKGRWVIDWKQLDMTSKDAAVEWKERQRRLDNSMSKQDRRAKSFKIDLTLFDKPTEEQATAFIREATLLGRNKAKRHELSLNTVKEIYEETGKIVHRDTLFNLSDSTVEANKPANKEIVEKVNTLMLDNNASLADYTAVAKYLTKIVNNKTKVRTIIIEDMPEAMVNKAKEIMATISVQSDDFNLINDKKRLAYAGIMGFRPHHLLIDFNEDHDAVRTKGEPVESSECKLFEVLCLAPRYDSVEFARCLGYPTDAYSITFKDQPLTKATLVKQGNGDMHGMKGTAYRKRLVEYHSKDVFEWLNNPDNFHKYHLCRRRASEVPEFNYSAIAISMLLDDIIVHPEFIISLTNEKNRNLIPNSPLLGDPCKLLI